MNFSQRTTRHQDQSSQQEGSLVDHFLRLAVSTIQTLNSEQNRSNISSIARQNPVHQYVHEESKHNPVQMNNITQSCSKIKTGLSNNLNNNDVPSQATFLAGLNDQNINDSRRQDYNNSRDVSISLNDSFDNSNLVLPPNLLAAVSEAQVAQIMKAIEISKTSYISILDMLKTKSLAKVDFKFEAIELDGKLL